MSSMEDRIQKAQSAGTEELWAIVRDPNSDVITSATLNRNLTEEMAVFIAKRNVTSQETLGFLANDVRFKGSYKLKLAICKNPKCPPRVSLALIKFLRIFDLSDISRSKHLPVILRQKIELLIMERIPTLPAGIKIALSKRANSTIILALMDRGDRKVIKTCLDSPVLTEEHIYKIVNRSATKPFIIAMISEHPKWSLRYLVRFGLIRNFNTPMRFVTAFIGNMKTKDLKDLFADPKLPTSTKPFIFSELQDRKESTHIEEEKTFDLSDEEDTDLTDTWKEIH